MYDSIPIIFMIFWMACMTAGLWRFWMSSMLYMFRGQTPDSVLLLAHRQSSFSPLVSRLGSMPIPAKVNCHHRLWQGSSSSVMLPRRVLNVFALCPLADWQSRRDPTEILAWAPVSALALRLIRQLQTHWF